MHYKLADEYLAAKRLADEATTRADAYRESIIALIEAGATVTASSGEVANLTIRNTDSYRVKEVLALVRSEKLDAGVYLSVKTAPLRKLAQGLWEKLPYTRKSAKVLSFK